MRQTQSESQSSWSHYAKAAAVFALTTATYLLARTTGWLPGWFSSEKSLEDSDKSSALTTLSAESSVTISTLEKRGRGDFKQSVSSALADLQTTELTDITITEEDSDQPQISSIRRRLLQQQTQQSSVMVVNPIPDQVIEIGQPYSYSLDNIFSGNYTLLGAVETGKTSLPNWLNLQCKLISSYQSNVAGFAISGSVLFAADSSARLQIINVSNMSNPLLLSTYPGGSTSVGGIGIAISGTVLFLGSYLKGLQIIDVSNLTNPRLLSTYPAGTGGGYAQGIAISDDTVFVADGSAGLQIIDVSNLTNPRLLSTYPAGAGYANGVAVSSKTVFLADNSGLQIIDVSNLTNPRLLGTYPAGSGYTNGIAVSGTMVFVADVYGGLQIIDVSNLMNPRLLSTYPAGAGRAYGVAVSGETVFVADDMGGLQIIDVSNLTNPRLLNTYLGSIFDVAVFGTTVFVGDVNIGRIQILDLRSGNLVGIPSNFLPGQIFSITVEARNLTHQLGSHTFTLTLDYQPRAIRSDLLDQSLFPNHQLSLPLNSELLFVNSRGNFLTLFLQLVKEKPAPSWCELLLTPVRLSFYPATNAGYGAANGVAVSGETVFVADDVSLQIIDVSNLINPRLLSTYPAGLSGMAYDVTVLGTTVFVADGYSGLQIIDVSNLTNPRLLSIYPAGSGFAYGVAVLGTTVFVADGVGGLQIIDASDLMNPRLLSTYPAGSGYTYGVAVSGQMVFVADNNAGLQIIDVSNLTNPRLLSITQIIGSAHGVAVSNITVFLADDLGGLQIIDVSNLTNPQLLGSYPVGSGSSYGVAVSGKTVFVADEIEGLQIIDVGNLENPRLLGIYLAGSGFAYGVAVLGTTAYVADEIEGLQIIDLNQWQLTLLPSESDVGNYPLRLTAIDDLGGESYIDFTVRVEGPPQLNGSIPLQRAWVGQLFNYFIPQNLFVDPNNDVIGYSASMIGGKSLPNWLRVNPLTIGFSGVPQSGDWGNVTITLSATDHICPETPTVNFTISVGFLPVLSHRIPNQLAPIGSPYQFSVPKNSFFDPVGLALSYLAQGMNNQPLPDWLEFNTTSLLFFGVANTSNITMYTLQLIATNSAGGQVIASFTLRTDHFPVFNKILSLPIASVNQPWVWTLPSDTFIDEDGDPLTYSAAQEDSSPLPSWLSFNPIIRTFTGAPLFTGTQGLKISAQDSYGGSNSRYFNITILSASQSGSEIAPLSARAGKLFAFQVNASSILGSDEALNYSALLTDGASLPSWLQFISNNLSFTGLPKSTDVGSYDITLIATDSQEAHYNVSFMLNVNPNYPPQVYLPVSNQVAQVNELFVFYAPEQTFVDPNGDNLTYSVSILPSWLSFDPTQLKFWGMPGRGDTDPLTAHVINVELTAHDDESQTSTLFTISVQGTSNLMMFLQIGIPLLSGLASLYEAYQNRALLLNRCCRNRIVKHEAIVITGEEFHVALTTEPKEVGKIQVKLPKLEETKSTTGCCSRLFRPCKRVIEESPDHLPPAYPLPTWLKYSDSNRLFSTGRVPQVKHPQFTVQVLNSGGVIREEVNVIVQAMKV